MKSLADTLLHEFALQFARANEAMEPLNLHAENTSNSESFDFRQWYRRAANRRDARGRQKNSEGRAGSPRSGGSNGYEFWRLFCAAARFIFLACIIVSVHAAIVEAVAMALPSALAVI